jgi:hypothetical protein
MEMLGILRELWQRKAMLVPVAIVATAVAIFAGYKVPSFQKRSVQIGAASSQILVDSPASTLVEGADAGSLTTLAARAQVYAQYLSSLEARSKIAAASGIPAGAISTHGPFSAEAGRANYTPQPSEGRANDILKEGRGYRLVFAAQEDVPIITVSAQAPTANAAVKLADASYIALEDYVKSLEQQATKVPNKPAPTNADGHTVESGVAIRELGAPEGGTIGSSNGKILMAFAWMAVFGLGSLVVVLLPRVARQWRQLDTVEELGDILDPTGGGTPFEGSETEQARAARERAASAWS